jgi:lipopolysaccharide heptosyltransferase II
VIAPPKNSPYFSFIVFTPDKTLVIRFSSIGDIVLVSPLLRVLRKKFPSAQIDFVTKKEYAELVRYNRNVNFTFEFDAAPGFGGLYHLKEKIRREQYDCILDIHGSLRSRYLRTAAGAKRVMTINKRIARRTMLVNFKKNFYRDTVSVADRYIEPLRVFGIENDGEGLELFIPDNVAFGTAGKMAPLNLNRFEKTVGICPSAKHETKRWPQERFAEAASRLAMDHDAKVLLFGGASDKAVCGWIAQAVNATCRRDTAADLSGSLTLLETAAAMEFCDVIVTNDSGLMHVASAMKKNIVAIFGSTVKEFGFFPVGGNAVVLERPGLPCRPCSHIGRDKCPEGHFKCMNEIRVEDVVRSAAGFIRKAGSSSGKTIS